MKLRRYDETIKSFDNCLATGSPSPALHEARGLALAYNGSYGRAIADYTLALHAGRKTASLYSDRGWAYLFGGAPGPAANDFDEALRLDCSDGRDLSGRSLANIQQRKVREAVADVRAAAQTSPRDPRLLYNAARVICQAAACLESDTARSNGAWEAAGRYRVEALTLIARSVEILSAAERARFWRDVVSTDSALEPVRKSRKFLELDGRLARSSAAVARGGALSR